MFFRRFSFAFLFPALLVALPLILRPRNTSGSGSTAVEKLSWKTERTDRLVIVSPHSEAIKYEFALAFRRHYLRTTGRDVEFDWRDLGGTNDITRYINDRFTAAFRLAWLKNGGCDSLEPLKAFQDPECADHPARKFFLASDIGIGIDLFFGGGTYEHSAFAKKGFAIDGGVAERHQEYLDSKITPCEFAGELLHDPRGRFYGCCLSSFGIAANPDRFKDEHLPLPETWTDLTRPELFQKIVVADPTKSGSVMKCYEMILQQAMNESGPDAGWIEGFRRIRLIAANARNITDSAGNAVRDVSSGAAMAGICIDFYGFSEAAWTRATTGKTSLVYRMPPGGSAVTSDPVQLFRGAPHPETAKAFLDFLLSPEGQRLWIQKPGTPGGPEKYGLFRMCVRRDLLASTNHAFLSNPEYDPFRLAGTFRYHGEWTGQYFTLIRVMIKCLILDPMDELRRARRSILENGGDALNQDALEALSALPFPYAKAAEAASALSSGDPVAKAALRRKWTEFALTQYRRAADLARTGTKKRGGGK